MPFLDLKRELAPRLDELTAAAERVIKGGWFILGEELRSFEQELAAHDGRAHAIGVGNGLDAIRLILQAHGVGRGDEVVMPATTFIATALAVHQVGATVVLADVDPETLLLEAASAAKVITKKTKVLLPVHLYGQLADTRSLASLGIPIVEDAAQAHGARRNGNTAGAGTVGASHSFYPGKNLGALGDAGAVTTDHPDLAERLWNLRNYGQAEKYLHTELGLNSRLDEMQAAFLRVRLRYLDVENAARTSIAERYRSGLRNAPGLRLLGVPAGSVPSWHLFPVRHGKRDELRSALAEDGIETLVHYPRALHHQPALKGLVAESGFPVSEDAARTLLSLPMAPSLTPAEVERVIEAVSRACARLAP